MSTDKATFVRRRKRARLACDICRARKVGCDGRRPVCVSCDLRGLGKQCAYQDKGLSSSALGLFEVDSRLRKLEEKVGMESPTTQDTTSVRPAPNSAASLQQGGSLIDQRHLAAEETSHGAPSNIAFFKQVLQLESDSKDAEQSIEPLADPRDGEQLNLLGFTADLPHSLLARDVDPTSPPDRQLSTMLLERFFAFVNPIFPILHRPSIMIMFDRLWQPAVSLDEYFNRTRDDLVFHAILNMIFALGCQNSQEIPVVQRNHFADSFYKRSHRLISVETLDFSSLQIVQLLLLRGIYLHYTTYADRCWNTIGVALRVAQGLGLDSGRTTATETQVNREMRRRVWHSCISLDRLSATTFGRPVLLHRPHFVPLPEPIDDEFLLETNEGCQPDNLPSRLTFFIHNIKLFEVLNDILTKIYSQANSREQESLTEDEHSISQYLNDLPRLCSKLDDISKDLPSHLRADDDNTATDTDAQANCFRMQARVLKSRIQYIRLLLLRPSLLASARQRLIDQRSVDSSATLASLRKPYLRELNVLCISAVHDALGEMHQNLSNKHNNSAWHTLFFTFAAASALLAASLCPELGINMDRDRAKTSWERAMQIFEFYKSSVESAGKGLEVLAKFRQRFSETFTQDELSGSNGQIADSTTLDDAFVVDETWLAGITDEFDEFFTSDSLDRSWLGSQDFGWARP